MKTNFRIQPASPADRRAVEALLAEASLPLDGLADHFDQALVGRDGQTIAGCVALELYGTAALLRSLAVRPEYRGTGLGRRLTQAALELAQQQGVTAVYLLTETAANFFPRFGFIPIDRSEVPGSVHKSVEFTTACPASAQAMVKA